MRAWMRAKSVFQLTFTPSGALSLLWSALRALKSFFYMEKQIAGADSKRQREKWKDLRKSQQHPLGWEDSADKWMSWMDRGKREEMEGGLSWGKMVNKEERKCWVKVVHFRLVWRVTFTCWYLIKWSVLYYFKINLQEQNMKYIFT